MQSHDRAPVKIVGVWMYDEWRPDLHQRTYWKYMSEKHSLLNDAWVRLEKGHTLVMFEHSRWYIELIGKHLFNLWTPHCSLLYRDRGHNYYEGTTEHGLEMAHITKASALASKPIGFLDLGTLPLAPTSSAYAKQGLTNIDALLYSGWVNSRTSLGGRLVHHLLEVHSNVPTCAAYVGDRLQGEGTHSNHLTPAHLAHSLERWSIEHAILSQSQY
jgi:hypothetical protein